MAMTHAQITQELGRLHALEAELAGQLANMTASEKIKALEDAQPKVKLKSKELAFLLESGYGMSIETANAIIKERDANPQTWPIERYEAAKAMLAAFTTKPQVVSTRPGWRRSRR